MNNTPAIFEDTLSVQLFECDFERRWKPAAFFQHLIELGTRHAETLGWGYDAMLDGGFFWVNARMKMRFFGYPRAGQSVRLRTWPKTIQQKIFFVRDFEVESESGQRLAAATCAFVVVNASTRRMSPLSALNIELPETAKRSALDEPLEKIAPLAETREALRVMPGYSAVDLLGHVNTSRYIEWLCDAFPFAMYREQQISWLQVTYEHEVLPGEEVSLRAGEYPGGQGDWYVQGLKITNGTRAFEAALGWEKKGD